MINCERYQKDADGKFGPTHPTKPEGNPRLPHYYAPIDYHRPNAQREHKSNWCIAEYQEYELFRMADENDWSHHNRNHQEYLYSIYNEGKEILGKHDERLARFEEPQNAGDPWHGTPVHNINDRHDDVVEKWFRENIIKKPMRIKLLKKKLR